MARRVSHVVPENKPNWGPFSHCRLFSLEGPLNRSVVKLVRAELRLCPPFIPLSTLCNGNAGFYTAPSSCHRGGGNSGFCLQLETVC